MILPQLASTLQKHKVFVNLYKKQPSAKNTHGEYVNSFEKVEGIELPTTPISGKQLFLSETGSYNSEDRNFFVLLPDDLRLQYEDEIQMLSSGAIFIVKDIKDLTNEAGFIRYACKRKIPQSLPENILTPEVEGE